MSWLRALMLLCLSVWIGGIILFAFVLAPTLFTVLPTRELAGNVVIPTLSKLHRMGLISGLVFLVCSLVYNRMKHAQWRAFSATHILLVVMLALTLISQFSITPRMRTLRAEMGVIDNRPGSDSRRMEFNRLHQWSTRAEGGVLFLGLAVVVLTARRFS
jgi:DMSO/TMAO reductase YedYZ heme-binding membrane subunit